MSTVLMAVILFGFSGLSALMLKRRIEEQFAFSIAGITLLLYVFGVFGALQAGLWAVLILAALACILLALMLVKRRKEGAWKQIATPGALVFLLFMVMVMLIHRNRMFAAWDEFSHWGLEIKNMYLLGQIPNASPDATINFASYPPAAALFSHFWIWLSRGFNEGDAYRAANIFMLAALMPLMRSVDWKAWKKGIVLTVLMLYIPIIYNYDAYRTVYVDALLGCLMAYGLMVYYRNPWNWTTACQLTLSLAVLSLIKASGQGLAIMTVLIVTVDVLLVRKTEGVPYRKLKLLAPLFGVLAAVQSWKMYLSGMETEAGSVMSGLRTLITQGLQPYQVKTLKSFFDAISNMVISEMNIGYLVELSLFLWLAFFVVIAVWAVEYTKEPGLKKTASIRFWELGGGLVVYILMILVTYLTVFDEREAMGMESFGRYASTVLIAMSAVFLSQLLVVFPERVKRWSIASMALVVALCLVNPVQLIRMTYDAGDTVIYRQEMALSQETIRQMDPATDKVYIINQAVGGDYYVCRYEFTPVHVQKGNHWLMTSPPEDKWAQIYATICAPEEWEKNLRDEGFTWVYLHKVDDDFRQSYRSLFRDPQDIKDGMLLKVVPDGEGVVLVQEAL